MTAREGDLTIDKRVRVKKRERERERPSRVVRYSRNRESKAGYARERETERNGGVG